MTPAFPLGTPTIPGILLANGYRTALSGKWHLGSDPDHGPNHFGFESSYGSLAGAVGMYDHRYREGPFEHTWHRDHRLIDGSENGTHATDLVTQEAVRVIEAEDSRPFFLYVPFHSVHTPLDERGAYVERPTQRDPTAPERWLDEDNIPWFHDPDGKIQSESDPEKRLLLAAVHHLDDAVGRIVSALNRSGKRDSTLLLFSSDNGPQGSWNGKAYPDDLKLTDFNQTLPFRGLKLDVWEGGIRVPAFANWPGTLQPRQETTPTHIVDWLPTLSGLVETREPPPADIDGVSLTGLLLRQEPVNERDLYWTWNSRTNRWALRHGDWKIVKYGRGAPVQAGDWQLFNIQNDPAEATNLADSEPGKLRLLHQSFLRHRSRDAKK